MRSKLVGLLVLALFPSSATAAPVLFLARDGQARIRIDPFITGPAITPNPGDAGTGIRARAASPGASNHPGAGNHPGRANGPGAGKGKLPGKAKRRHRPKPKPTVRSVLAQLHHSHAITDTAYKRYSASFTAALATEKRLTGTRLAELTSVTETMHAIAVAGAMIPSRLPAMFETLDRNRQWWTTGPLLSAGQRVEFDGSPLVWEYYAGQGIQLQVLGSFGKANGLYTAGAGEYPQLVALLSQLIPLASQRPGAGLTWEYYFSFDGGSPPWTSAMSQATGLEALSRAYRATRNPYYLQVGSLALKLFETAPPAGVGIPTSLGTRYLQYTFAPGTAIINAFLQSLIGLDDFAHVSNSPLSAELFRAGDAEALRELPSYDTGAWSLYQPGIEDDLSYHELVTGFLAQLCTLTGTPLYCTTAAHFRAYLTTPPGLTQLTFHGRTHTTTDLRFALTKSSHVGITVRRGSQIRFQTSASFPYGVDSFSIPPLLQPGRYSVALAGSDLAGNFARVTGTLDIAR